MMIDLGVKRLIIPKAAGIFSAAGGLTANMVADFQRNFECNSSSFDFEGVNRIQNILTKEGTSFLQSNGVKPENRKLEYSVDARYLSQPWDLTISHNIDTFKRNDDVVQLVETFHKVHDRMRGSREEGQFVEFSNWRVKALGKIKTLEFFTSELSDNNLTDDALVGHRKAYFKDLGGLVETPIYNGDRLRAGNSIGSPAIIEEMATTIVIFPGSRLRVSAAGNYLVELD